MINIDALNDEEKLAALESIHKSIAESKEIQRKKITTNVEMIVKALKKIEADLKQRYDETGQLIANLKSGEDGRDGKDGKDGKNGKDGRDGPMGPRGYDGVPGRNGLDGTDGVSVTDAHIDFDGSLIISLSSGRVINVGEVVAADIAEKIKVITNGGGTSQSVLDALASLQAQIDAIASGLEYQGTWNASTNTPTLASSVGTAGYYYIVATAGSTNLNGITDWQIGDWAVFNGTIWQKIDQTNLVTSVAGRTGAIVLTTADIGGLGTIATQAANNVSITGGSISGITDLAIADGGTGASTAAAAITALTGTQTSGYYLRSNGTGAFLSSIQAADVPTLNQNTTGSAATLSLTNPVSRGGTNLTSLTNKGVLYASSTSQVATGTALQFDGNNLGVSATPSAWSTAHRAIEIGDQTSVSFFSSGATKVSTFATNIYNVSTIGARDYYKANGVAAKYTQYTGEHAWSTAPSGIAGPTTGITTGRVYTNLTAGNQPDFGASDGFVGTIWTATSSGTLSSGTVVQNVDFVESMRIDTSSNVGIGTSSPGSRLDVKGTLRLSGSTSGYVGFAPAAAAGSTTYTLPSADGTSGQSLTTNGSGTLSWASGSGGTVTSVAASGGTTGLTFSGSPITTSGTLTLGGTLAVANGGTGTATPALVAGTNVTITGSWPNQTINSSNTGGTVTSVGGTGTVSGLTLTGTVTSSGNLTLGGALDLSAYNGAGAFTTLSASSTVTLSGGTANGVAYLNGSKVVTSGSALTFDGTNLGVGTASPTQKLQVVGNVLASSGSWFGFGDADERISADNTGFMQFFVNASERIRIDSSGNVGIATTSPTQKLTVSGNVLASNGAWFGFGDADERIVGDNSGSIQHFVSGSEQMRLTSTGLGIGTSSPQTKLDVRGNVYIATTVSGNNILALGNIVGVGPLTGAPDGVQGNSFIVGESSSGSGYPGFLKFYTSTGGVVGERARIDSSGNLLLGTTSNLGNASRLSVQVDGSFGAVGFARNTDNTFAVATDYYKSRGSASSPTAVQNGDDVYQLRSVPYQGSAYTYLNSMKIQIDGTYTSGQNPPTRILWYTNTANGSATERLRLDSSGNLGLGVTPSAWAAFTPIEMNNATIAGQSSVTLTRNSYFNGVNWVYKNTGSNGASQYQLSGNGNHIWNIAASGTAGNTITFTQAMTLDASGNLGIGTTSPNFASGSGIEIQRESANATLRLDRGTTGDSSLELRAESGQTAVWTTSSTPMLFATANTERARIDSSGNFGVGQTPTTSINQTAGTTIASSGYMQIQRSAANPFALARFGSSSGTITDFYYNATSVGTISITASATAYNTSSDYRLKNIDGPLTGSGDFIDALKPKVGTWKADGSKFVGFLAHEVQEVSPQTVVGEKDAVDEDGKPVMQAMEYGSSEFIANIIAELQSLRKRIATLEAK